MFWILLGAQLSVPVPSNPRMHDVREVFDTNDFPQSVISAGVSRVVYTRTTVLPTGVIRGCGIERPSGNALLDQYTCALILKRAKLLPARWTDGSPAYGVLRLPVSWTLAEAPMPHHWDEIPDVDVNVNQLPKGASSPVVVRVQVAADVAGRISDCIEYEAEALQSKAHFPQLVQIACSTVIRSFTAMPAVDEAGKPVRSVQLVSVRFTKDH